MTYWQIHIIIAKPSIAHEINLLLRYTSRFKIKSIYTWRFIRTYMHEGTKHGTVHITSARRDRVGSNIKEGRHLCFFLSISFCSQTNIFELGNFFFFKCTFFCDKTATSCGLRDKRTYRKLEMYKGYVMRIRMNTPTSFPFRYFKYWLGKLD